MLKHHAIPGEMFIALARGHGGALAGRWLTVAERSKHMVLLRGVVHTASAAAHPRADEIRIAYQTLSAMHRQIPGAVDGAVQQPAVGAWALDVIQRMRRDEFAADIPERINALAAAAAIRARFPHVTTVPAIGGAVVLPSVGLASSCHSAGESTARVRITMNGAEVVVAGSCVRIPPDPSCDADGWQGMRAITAVSRGLRLRVIVDDLDPYRFAASAGLDARLEPAEAEHWSEAVREAWRLLVRHHGRVADEVRTIVTTLTPLKARDSGHCNATSRETFGCVAVSRPCDGHTLALALAHEVQHAKLAALLDLVDLIQPGAAGLYYAPWRDDPRPLVALLHGTYAHLGVADFWRHYCFHDVARCGACPQLEFARWRTAVAEATAVLRGCPDMTPLGHIFVTGIKSTLLSWCDDRVPSGTVDLARAITEGHRQRWLGAYGNQLGGGSKSQSSR